MEPEETPVVPAVSPEDGSNETPKDDGKDSAGGLRKQLEKALTENRGLKADKRDEILAGIGLEPDKGLGKALVERFDDGKITIENLAQVAADDYGHVIPEGQHPQAVQIAQGQQEVQQLQATGGSIAPPSQADALAKAEAEGDHATSLRIKGQQMADMLKPGR